MNHSFTPLRGSRDLLTDRFLWLVRTVFWVLFAPYLLVGLFMGCARLGGIDMHGALASFDTLNSSDWGALGKVFTVIHIVLAVLIVLARVWVSLPVRLWRIRMNSACQRSIADRLRVTERLERSSAARWIDRHMFGISVVVVCSIVVLLVTVAGYAAHQPHARVPVLQVIRPPVSAEPHASAVVVQHDGTLESGVVTLRQVSGQTYEITFLQAR